MTEIKTFRNMYISHLCFPHHEHIINLRHSRVFICQDLSLSKLLYFCKKMFFLINWFKSLTIIYMYVKESDDKMVNFVTEIKQASIIYYMFLFRL